MLFLRITSCVALAVVVFSTAASSIAAGFDFTGSTVSATMHFNGGTYSSGPFGINEGGSATFQFMDAGNTPAIAVLFDDDTSAYIGHLDHQVRLNFVTFENPGMIEAGFSVTITGVFSPQAIGGFEFVSGFDPANLLGKLASSYNAQTGTLVITSLEDISMFDMTNLLISGRFLAIPEPASVGVLAGLAAVAATAFRRRRHR